MVPMLIDLDKIKIIKIMNIPPPPPPPPPSERSPF